MLNYSILNLLKLMFSYIQIYENVSLLIRLEYSDERLYK